MRNRIIYNTLGVFAGPAPCTGYHFINDLGVLNDSVSSSHGSGANYNLLKEINRIQSVGYSIQTNRVAQQAVGKKASLDSQPIFAPTVNLSFDYVQAGILNELRLGFYCNYAQPFLNDAPYYSNNYGVCCISGFLDRTEDREINPIRWPFKNRDCRNFFVAVRQEGYDLNNFSTGQEQIAPDSPNYGVFAFGNSYLNSYSAKGEVGAAPAVSVSFSCYNVEYLSSGSGCVVPAINNKTAESISGMHFAIPSVNKMSLVPLLLPGDIKIDLTSRPRHDLNAINGTGVVASNNSSSKDLLLNIENLAIQGYTLDLNLPREEINQIGHRFPADRPIKFPVPVTCSFGILANELMTGSLARLNEKNEYYDLAIKLENPTYYQEGIGVRYDIKGCKFISSDFSVGVGSNMVATLNFATEIDLDDYSKGLFISGLLNTSTGFSDQVFAGFLTQESGDYLLQEDNSSKFMLYDNYQLLY